MDSPVRNQRMQIMLTKEESAAIDDWRFQSRMPSRAAAVRELLKLSLNADESVHRHTGFKSGDIGVARVSPRKSVSRKKKK